LTQKRVYADTLTNAYKDRSFKNLNKNRKSESKTVSFKHNGAHAANVALPPPPYTQQEPEEHFTFKASHEPIVKTDNEEKDIYNVYPVCTGTTFRKEDKKEIEYTDYEYTDYDVFGSRASEASDGESNEDSSSEDNSEDNNSDNNMIPDQRNASDLNRSDDENSRS
jgi:hypothetical protein